MGEKAELPICAVCGGTPRPSGRMSRVTIQSRTVLLCRQHAGLVAIKMPRTWDELRAIFPARPITDERRSALPRRVEFDDRRLFPPRPEGRRASLGRRREDPSD